MIFKSSSSVMEYSEFRANCFLIRKTFHFLPCGSTFELPVKYLKKNITDIDKLFYQSEICAIPKNRNPPKNFKGTLLTVESTDTSTGFARLRLSDATAQSPSQYFCRPQMLQYSDRVGPALVRYFDLMNNLRNFFGENAPLIREIEQLKIDCVYAVHCPYWPPEADEWKSRKRIHGWPDDELIARVTNGGCHFVSKPHLRNLDDITQWRFSFSKAELLLIHSWTNVQKHVYHILRLVKTEVLKRIDDENDIVLPTYYFKTLMLWTCEKKPPEFWNGENLVECVQELLILMVEWLIERRCQNYFMPRNNMMDSVNEDGTFDRALELLTNYVGHGVNRIVTDNFSVFVPNGYHLKFPIRFTEYCLFSLMDSVDLRIEKESSGKLRQRLLKCEWFLPELRFLHAAIDTNLRLMSLDSVLDRRKCRCCLSAERNFECALRNTFATISCNIINGDLSLYENVRAILNSKQTNIIENYSRKCDLIYSRNSVTGSKCIGKSELNRMLSDDRSAYTGNFCDVEMKSNSDPCSTNSSHLADHEMSRARMPSAVTFQLDLQNECRNGTLIECAFSPTYILASSLKANFYYNALQDYHSARIECCRALNAIARLKSEIPEAIVIAKCIPVLVSENLSRIYDEHLQVIIGFISLRAFHSCTLQESTDKKLSRTMMLLKLCPLQFLKYIYFQSMRKLYRDTLYYTEYKLRYASFSSQYSSNVVEMSEYSIVVFYASLRQSGAKVRLRCDRNR